MKFSEKKLKQIYLDQMVEVLKRLDSSCRYLEAYKKHSDDVDFDSGVLQFRKALEAVAYASIAPNKNKYQAFRNKAESNKDFTKDFNASKIFLNLKAINRDFYPVPLVQPKAVGYRKWHYDRKSSGCLTQNKFKRLYDRLGKFLHANNPWGTQKDIQGLVKDIFSAITQVRELLELHAAFIRTREFTGVWVVEVPKNGATPKIMTAIAGGEFNVGNS